MIKYHAGFLPLDGSVPRIIHCIARDRRCGAGFALQVRNLKEHFTQLRTAPDVGIGGYHTTNAGGFRIVHLVTKERSNGKPTRESFNETILRFAEDAIRDGENEWHCPMMGSGLDRLSWSETEALLTPLPIQFNVWVPKDNPISTTR